LDLAAGLAGNLFQGLGGLVRVGAGEMNHVSAYDSVHATRMKVCDEMVREALGLESRPRQLTVSRAGFDPRRERRRGRFLVLFRLLRRTKGQ
jgi:hypothetical protein